MAIRFLSPACLPVSLSLDLKSIRLDALQLALRERHVEQVLQQARALWGEPGSVFAGEPLVLDLHGLPSGPDVDWAALVQGLRAHALQPVALRGAQLLSAREQQVLQGLGLQLLDDAPPASPPPPPAPPAATSAAPTAAAPQPPAPETRASTCVVVDRVVRSGQQVYARDADLVVLGLVSHGAEVIADGHVHVYGALRGRAIAGAKGRLDARVFAQCFEPELVAIAGTFRTSEKPLPAEVLGKAAQVRLDGERLVFEPLKF